MPKTHPEPRDIVGAALVAAAATGAAAHIPDGDTLIDAPVVTAPDVASALDAPLDLLDLAELDDPRFLGGAYLVAEDHDGTWAGGVGRDVIKTGDRTRSFRDRLSRGGVAGGLAVIAAFAVLAWTAIRRRMR